MLISLANNSTGKSCSFIFVYFKIFNQMKKFSLVLLVALFGTFVFSSCNKKEDSTDLKIYAQVVKVPDNSFIVQDGDIILKSAPLVGGHDFQCLRQYPAGSAWAYVDGTEFLPGSAAAVDWSGGQTSWWFSVTTPIHVTYCPAVPMRFVSIARDVQGGNATYLGLYDCTPNANSFPITLKGRRLGDVLTVNTDALTALPGYTNMSFDVTYTKNIIDLKGTIFNSSVDTQNGWPDYTYSASSDVTTTLSGANLGNQVVYDGTDATITGTVTIVIHVDNTTITKTTIAPGSDQGLAITLTTTKVGWYDSGTINQSDIDISVSNVEIPVN